MRERPVELEMDCYDTEGNHFGIAPSTPICVWVAVGPINWSVQRERDCCWAEIIIAFYCTAYQYKLDFNTLYRLSG